MNAPTIQKIRRNAGIAGQVSFEATVQYDGEDPSTVTFVGSTTYGGPVVMVTPANPRGTFVRHPGRFGDFGEAWVRRFFEDAS